MQTMVTCCWYLLLTYRPKYSDKKECRHNKNRVPVMIVCHQCGSKKHEDEGFTARAESKVGYK